MLNLCFFGKTRFEYNGVNFTAQLGAKAVALLCLLVLNKSKYLSREKIITYLWPDSNEEAAKNNLRFNLWLIKKNIGKSEDGEAFLYVDKESCAINSKYQFKCDVLQVMNFEPKGSDSIESLLTLKNLFYGDFMEGCYFSNCNDFNEIIILERTKFEEYRVKILKRIAELYESEDKLDLCGDILKEIIDIEPYDEETAGKILDLYVKMGRRSSAVLYYQGFRNKLAGQLGIQPSDELRKRFEEIQENFRIEKTLVATENDTAEDGDNAAEAIEIYTHCMRGVPYFWMADVVGQLFQNPLLDYSSVLKNRQILDLSYIQPDILSYPEGNISSEVPNVRIVNAFIRLIEGTCKITPLVIKIHNRENMDEISANTIQYLESVRIKRLTFSLEV